MYICELIKKFNVWNLRKNKRKLINQTEKYGNIFIFFNKG